MSRTTGSWIVRKRAVDRRPSFYLIGGPFDPDSIRSWLAWSGNAADAYVFPTKTAARQAITGHGQPTAEIAIERSLAHEESTA